MLDALLGEFTFDPLAFESMKPKEQAEMLRSIAGVDFAPLDKKYKILFDERSDVNRDVKKLEGYLASMSFDAKAPAHAPEVDDILAELDAATSAHQEQTGRENALASILDHLRQANADIQQLEAKLEAAKARKKELQAQGKEVKATIESAELPDLDAIRKQFADISAVQKAVSANAEYKGVEAKLKAAQKQSREMTVALDGILKEKDNLLKQSPLPVDGLTFDEAEVFFQGVPFEQAAQSVRLRVGVAIGLARKPELRVMLIREGARLDKKHLALMAEIAKESDAQLWIERVGQGDECTVIIDDGEVMV